jgi:bifunctional DNase/RNase
MATVHVAIVDQRRLLVDSYYCDAHGEKCVTRNRDSFSVGNLPVLLLPGAVCCDVRLILSRPVIIGESQYVHLREVAGTRWLGLYCGFIEAAVMLSSLAVPSPIRPFLHDVAANIVSSTGGTIQYVFIHDLIVDGPFYVAEIAIEVEGKSVSVDARPSDAISLAIRSCKPIFVSERLLSGS